MKKESERMSLGMLQKYRLKSKISKLDEPVDLRYFLLTNFPTSAKEANQEIIRMNLNHQVDLIYKVRCPKCGTIISGGVMNYHVDQRGLMRSYLIGQNDLLGLKFKCSNCNHVVTGSISVSRSSVYPNIEINLQGIVERTPRFVELLLEHNDVNFEKVKVSKHLENKVLNLLNEKSLITEQNLLRITHQNELKAFKILQLIKMNDFVRLDTDFTNYCPYCDHAIATGWANLSEINHQIFFAANIGGAFLKEVNFVCPFCHKKIDSQANCHNSTLVFRKHLEQTIWVDDAAKPGVV